VSSGEGEGEGDVGAGVGLGALGAAEGGVELVELGVDGLLVAGVGVGESGEGAADAGGVGHRRLL
jgi:hypothetical protein